VGWNQSIRPVLCPIFHSGRLLPALHSFLLSFPIGGGTGRIAALSITLVKLWVCHGVRSEQLGGMLGMARCFAA
jgi:hypothetical protein